MTVVGGHRTIPVLFAALADIELKKLHTGNFDNNQVL